MIDWIIKFMKTETFKYLFFGVLTTIVSFAVYAVCISQGANVVISNSLAYIVGVIFSYITTKIWVFDNRNFTLKVVFQEFSIFVLSRLFSFFLETACLLILVEKLFIDATLSKVVTSVLVIILNYLTSKFIIFKKNVDHQKQNDIP